MSDDKPQAMQNNAEEENIEADHESFDMDEFMERHEEQQQQRLEAQGISDYPSLRIEPDDSVVISLDADREFKRNVETQYGQKHILPVINDGEKMILWASDYLCDRIVDVIRDTDAEEIRITRTGEGKDTRYGVKPVED